MNCFEKEFSQTETAVMIFTLVCSNFPEDAIISLSEKESKLPQALNIARTAVMNSDFQIATMREIPQGYTTVLQYCVDWAGQPVPENYSFELKISEF